MNDTLRMLLMQAVQNGISLGVSFGLNLTAEQTGLVIAFCNSNLLLLMFFWKKGQEDGGASTVAMTVTTAPADDSAPPPPPGR